MALLLVCAYAASAQGGGGGGGSIIDRLNLDTLQIVSLGGSYGHVAPSQVEPTRLVAVQADYGAITANWRIVMGASYWASRYRDDVVQAFVDTLNRSVNDPAGKAGVSPSRINVYDVTFSGEARYTRASSGELKPFLGIGIAAHVINADGKLIKGTFVERSLDAISAGFFVTTGIALKVVSHVGVEASARADVLSGFRSIQARAGGAYFFGNLHGAPAR